jgi:hypothetical protein
MAGRVLVHSPNNNRSLERNDMQKITLVTALAVAMCLNLPAYAQHGGHGDHSGHGAVSAAKNKKPSATKRYTTATREYHAAHAKMMRDMDKPFTGDPDVDFYTHMIPHHQGAIDMARVALRHAKDPWTRQAAEAIIIAQQQEIAQFQGWLARHGAKVPQGGEPTYEINANSFPDIHKREAGSRDELVGQTWAPGSGVPVQR